MCCTYYSEPCQEVRAVVAQRAEVAAVRAAVELHAATLEVIRAQVEAVVAAEARPPLTNIGSMSETSVRTLDAINNYNKTLDGISKIILGLPKIF